TGILKWSSLVPYLSLDLFFHQPFLGAWIFAYVLIYYVSLRTKREGWMLYLTALFGGIFAILHFRSLAIYRNELCVVDAFGVIGLVAVRRKKVVPMAAAALPILWACAFVGLMMWRFAPATGISQKYFFGLVGGTIAVFGISTLLVKKYAPTARWP